VIRSALAILMVLLVVGCASLWMELNQPIRTVRVVGDLTAGEQAEIRDSISDSMGQGLLGVDLASVRSDIYALSWPLAVTVRRRWPGSIEIRVEKDLAVAAWGDQGYLTSDGRVMQFPDEPAGLPRFRCARSGPHEAMEIYGLLKETLATTTMNISALNESALGEWEVELDNGMRVVLGGHALAERMRRFRLVFERALQGRQETVRYVDARYANGIAVRWKEALVAYEDKTRYGI